MIARRFHVKAGSGGHGLASFRREKFVPRGGPDGGDGGSGGHVFLVVNPNLNTLLPFHYQPHYAAGTGQSGSKVKKHGKQGDDLTIAVPPGTVVTDAETGEVLADMTVPGERVRVARGGRGGLGNPHFATATHQAPRLAENGEPGEERWLALELKLIADVGLTGYPNAGKSTLISAISAAKPKIGDYPFTTLEPNLGVVEVDDETFVVADIPGLIEGAHLGVGLGDDFLRHVERTRVLIQVVDAAGLEGRDPLDDYRIINAELAAYDDDLAARPKVVALNKMDLAEGRANEARLREAIAADGVEVFAIAAAAGQGLTPLLYAVLELLRANPKPVPEATAATVRDASPEPEDRSWQVTRLSAHHWQVAGGRIERLVRMTDFGSDEATARLQRVLSQSGISRALERQGVEPGDTVHIAGRGLIWDEEAFDDLKRQRQLSARELGE